jgi:putative transposase
MRRGFLYLVAIMDWYSHKVLARHLSNSMDGKSAWRDNRMIERLWRSLKCECVYLNAFENGSQMRAGIGKWLTYYNSERPRSTHGILTSDEA